MNCINWVVIDYKNGGHYVKSALEAWDYLVEKDFRDVEIRLDMPFDERVKLVRWCNGNRCENFVGYMVPV